MGLQTIIILVGEAASGKSQTLHAMVDEHCTAVSGIPHIYSMKVKRLYLSLSSPQEYSACKFCDYKWVIRKIERWIQGCEQNFCVLLIMPFQIHFRRHTEVMNANCITEPINELRRTFKVHVVYLRKNGSRRPSFRLDRINKMMQGLKDDEIESRQGEVKRQAARLWDIVMRVDP